MNNITAIIPIHEYNDLFIEYLEKCINSIENQYDNFDRVILVVPKMLYGEYTKWNDNLKYNIDIISNDFKTDYQTQVSVGVKNVKTKYFTVIEFDDEISLKYLKNMVFYSNRLENVSMLLPTIIEVTTDNKKIKETNIQAWSKQLVGDDGDVGYINTHLLSQYTDFKLSGALINKNDFIELGGFKNNIELLFGLEFLLRLIKSQKKAYVIPKYLYKHVLDRKESLTDYYYKTFSKDKIREIFEKVKTESDLITKLNFN